MRVITHARAAPRSETAPPPVCATQAEHSQGRARLQGVHWWLAQDGGLSLYLSMRTAPLPAYCENNGITFPARVPTVIYAFQSASGQLMYPLYSAPTLGITFQLKPQFAAWRGEHEEERQQCMRDGPMLSQEEASALMDYVCACERFQRCAAAASRALAKYKDIL